MSYLQNLSCCVVFLIITCRGHLPSKTINEWRTNFNQCNANETCTDVFVFVRSKGGERWNETRLIHNCYCPESGSCPNMDNPNHLIFDTHIHRQILCRNVHEMPTCGRRDTAQQLLMRPEHNNYTSYFRVQCLCPRHLHPVWPTGGRRIFSPAARKSAPGFDYDGFYEYVDYRCNGL